MVINRVAPSRGLVLTVGDNAGMRQAIDALMDAAGFSGIVYRSSEELLADGQFPDALCVISDIKLPDGSGFGLLKDLRARKASTPVILISAKDSKAIRNRARSCGAAAYLPKPFQASELLAAIERIAESTRRGSSARLY